MIHLSKIISGGQTGVDRGAIGAALQAGFPYGGKIPYARKAEDGVVPNVFTEMHELLNGGYAKRTAQNIQDADGTLVLNVGSLLSGGTRLTVDVAEKEGSPLLVLDVSRVLLSDSDYIRDLLCFVLLQQIQMWLQLKWVGLHQAPWREWTPAHPVRTLNVAGPRESKAPGIERLTYTLMTAIIQSIGVPA